MYIYLDESGDLGFGEGSTEYFTIAFIVLEIPVLFSRCIRHIKEKYNIPQSVELKGNKTRKAIKKDLLQRLCHLNIEIHAITVKKENVDEKLRSNTNILYNYMVGLSLVKRVLQEQRNAKVIVQVDKRITSVTSGFRFNDYLKYKILYEAERRDINLNIHHLESHSSYAIQGIDVICNSIFRKYNSCDSSLFDVIRSKVKSDRRLFFSK